MSFRTFLIAVLSIGAIGTIASDCQAQNTFKRYRPLRWLGQGFSDGYHRCNPGYESSYYNPYSAHNSQLVSQSPEYLAVAGRFNDRPAYGGSNRFFAGVPFSVYAAPPQTGLPSLSAPGQLIESSFAPSQPAAEEPLFNNDFQPDEDLQEIEDADMRKKEDAREVESENLDPATQDAASPSAQNLDDDIEALDQLPQLEDE
jgi:hypothetical protein